MADMSDLLDIGEAAQFLSVSETSLRRWTNAGLMQCHRIGQRRERRFRRADLLAFLETQPVRPPLENSRPPADSTGMSTDDSTTLGHGGHLCALFGSELGRATLAVRFVLEGLQEGSMVYIVASARSTSHILGHLKEKRQSLQRDIAAGRLLVGDYQKNPRAQIEHFEVQLDRAAAAGAQSFRVFGDTWRMRRRASAQRFAEYEAAYERFIVKRYAVRTICAYDVRRFSGMDVLGALKAHRDTFRYPLERALA
jgi:excisionase family DNA binding protein